MKVTATSLGLFSLVAAANAQYFSDGWAPGKPTTQAAAAPVSTAGFTPQQPTGEKASQPALSVSNVLDLLDLNKLLATDSSVSLFSQLGINITEKLDAAHKASKVWDERVPLITDKNYNDLVVNEPLTEEEERTRTWIIVITVSTAKEDTISKLVDKVFDTAYNTTVEAGDLPNVRWGRIDYFNVTTITTKWAVWHAPYLVVLKDRGQTLRFYRPQNLRLNADALRTFLERDEYVMTPPWISSYGPGGANEYILDYLAIAFTKVYNVAVVVPRWILYLFSGGMASVLIAFLHRNSTKVAPTAAAKKTETINVNIKTEIPALAPESPAPATPQSGKRKKAKGKNGK